LTLEPFSSNENTDKRANLSKIETRIQTEYVFISRKELSTKEKYREYSNSHIPNKSRDFKGFFENIESREKNE
jgi:hypothetical protein